MLKRSKLRIINQNELLFLEEDKSAIVVNGELFMFSHDEEVTTP
jgi:hypothetical protein